MRRIFCSAFAAGAGAGLLSYAIQAAALFPMIDRAELLEHPAAMPAGGHLFYAVLADLLAGIGFALMLVAGMALAADRRGVAVDLRRGLLWGAAGFLVFALAPALGLPPALPGAETAGLAARQLWWLGTALATAAGLAAIVFGRRVVWRIAGVAAILAPHLLGAPQGPAPGASGGLTSPFALASLAVSAVFWLVIGGGGGFFYDRLGAAADRYAARPAAPR
ncbi:MAG TPA: CbtA family protein [Stellaceae bacterium]|nr:CbtA family protein [Stellaceae bacterium]